MLLFNKKSKAQRIRELLVNNGRATNNQLNRISYRYGAIIFNMRKDGAVIVTNRLDNNGLYEFVYRGQKEQ